MADKPYVHYFMSNYRKYGLTQKEKGNNGIEESKEIFRKRREQVINSQQVADRAHLDQLANFLTSLIYGDENARKANDIDEDMYKSFQKMVDKTFEEKYNGFKINWNNLSVYKKDKRTIQNKSYITAGKVVEYFNQVEQELSGSVLKKGKRERLLRLKESLQKEINMLIQQGSIGVNSNNEYNVLSPRARVAIDNFKTTYKGSFSKHNFITDLNYILGTGSLPTSKALGDVFEIFLGVAGIQLNNFANKQSAKLLKDVLVGDGEHGSYRTVNFKGLDLTDEEISASLGSAWEKLSDGVTWRTTSKISGKTDVEFQWQSNNLHVSAKNYGLKDESSKIHLVSNTPLWSLLQNEDPIFVGHWLNTIALNTEREAKRKASLASNNSKEKEQWSTNYSAMNEAHEALKTVILLKSLVGNDGDVNPADTLILNARSKKRVYVWTMSEVFNAAIKNLNVVSFSGYPYELPQSWIGGEERAIEEGEKRSSKLYLELHKKKIRASLKYSGLMKLPEFDK